MRSGFTLLEVALVIALLAMLAAMAMPAFNGAMAHRQLAESAERLRSLMYLGGAEARHSGRRLELAFAQPAEENLLASYVADAQLGAAYRNVTVRVERDPLGGPGVFDDLKVDWANWAVAGPSVQVARVEMSEPMPLAGDVAAGSFGTDPSDKDRPPSILFGNDGRSQVGDVTITLVNDRLDGYLVQLRGATGLATIRPMPAIQTKE